MIHNIFKGFGRGVLKGTTRGRLLQFEGPLRRTLGHGPQASVSVFDYAHLSENINQSLTNWRNPFGLIRSNINWALGGKRAFERIGQRLALTSPTAKFEPFALVGGTKYNLLGQLRRSQIIHEKTHLSTYRQRTQSVFGVTPDYFDELKSFRAGLSERGYKFARQLSDEDLSLIAVRGSSNQLNYIRPTGTVATTPVNDFLNELMAHAEQYRYLKNRNLQEISAKGFFSRFLQPSARLFESVTENTPRIDLRGPLHEVNKLTRMSESNFTVPGLGSHPDNIRPSRKMRRGGN